MTITPGTHRGIWVEGIALPTDLLVTDSVITWTRIKHPHEEWTDQDRSGFTTDTLLEDFLALSSADPEQMGAFLQRYGVLGLCGEHGKPDGHVVDGGYCPMLVVDGRPGLAVRHIRAASRSFLDLVKWGQMTRLGLKRPPDVGLEAQDLFSGFLVGDRVTDRERIAHYLTELNRQTGVRPVVKWEKRLAYTSMARGTMAALAILLTREIAARSDLTYTCSVCGIPVARGRPPQPDEAIYCNEDSCKREQRRRNQAAWRARKRAEGMS